MVYAGLRLTPLLPCDDMLGAEGRKDTGGHPPVQVVFRSTSSVCAEVPSPPWPRTARKELLGSRQRRGGGDFVRLA